MKKDPKFAKHFDKTFPEQNSLIGKSKKETEKEK